MRHVDEGTIHAWLDGQITDPAEAAWIEEHLRWCAACGARLAEERATLEQANALLSVAAPAAQPPAFDELVARAASAPPAAGSSIVPVHGRRWMLQAAWAATLLMAVGIGWTARELTDRAPSEPLVAQAPARALEVTPDGVEAETPAPAIVEPPAAAVTARGAAAIAPVEQQGTLGGRQAATAVPAEPTQQVASGLQSAAPDAQREAARRLLEDRAAVAPELARQALAPRPAAAVAAPPPSASAPPAAPIAAPSAAPTAAPPAAERAPVPGNVTVGGISAAQPGATGADWQPLARTDAAARSGMALYGIDGLTPTLTVISADRRIVRTVYRLESGATLELEQQREVAGTASALASQAAAARVTGASARFEGIAADLGQPGQRVWSGLRGDMRITLRTPSAAADLDALGMRLRVD